MREYEVLFKYLKESNWNQDGSPSADDDYYMIGHVTADYPAQIKRWVDTQALSEMCGRCPEIQTLFATDDYAEGTLEAVHLLSVNGHPIMPNLEMLKAKIEQYLQDAETDEWYVETENSILCGYFRDTCRFTLYFDAESEDWKIETENIELSLEILSNISKIIKTAN